MKKRKKKKRNWRTGTNEGGRREKERKRERERERGTTTGDDACTHVRAQNLISSSVRRPPRHPPRHPGVPIYGGEETRARSLGGNPEVSDIEVSVSFYFFVLLHPSPGPFARRIRSYIEIVSDISTLSFFRSRLLKYRRRVGRCRRREESGERGSARREEMAEESARRRGGSLEDREGRRGARDGLH